MRLNVGCGNHYAEGWTNVDIESNDQVKPDIQASLGNLPAEIQGVTHVYMGHVLEHIDYAEVPGMLRDLWTRCVPRAKVTIVGPDCTRARELHERSQLFGVDLSAVLYGAGRWQNDVHLWECTPELLTDALDRVRGAARTRDQHHR